jgi:hypothetical protein
MSTRPPLKTIGELKRQLAPYADDWEVDFSGLDFNRVKARAPRLVQIEFLQQVYRLEDGRVVIENLD